MNTFLTDIGALIGIAYTVALLGHIVYKGLVAKTFDEMALLDEEDR